MDYSADMNHCIEYIEAHLHEDLSAGMLSERAGYSLYHFCYIFKVYHDMPIGEYIRKRRLEKAAQAVKEGQKIIDVAILYGFETAAGFAKAFKKEFGVSATKYKKHHLNTKNRIEVNTMKMRIESMPLIKAAGYSFSEKDAKQLDLSKDGASWLGRDFSKVNKEDYAKLQTPNYGDISFWYHPQNDGSMSYFFGSIVKSFRFVPEGMAAVEIPQAKYAVFTVETDFVPKERPNDYVQAIKDGWKYIFSEGLSKNKLEHAHEGFVFELYVDDTTELYVAIK